MRKSVDLPPIRGTVYRITEIPASVGTRLYAHVVAHFGLGWLEDVSRADPRAYFALAMNMARVPPSALTEALSEIKPYTAMLLERTANGEINTFAIPFGGEKGKEDPWNEHFTGALSLVPQILLMEHLHLNFGEAFLGDRASSTTSESAQEHAPPKAPASSPSTPIS